MIKSPELIDDERFVTNGKRNENRKVLIPILQEVLKRKTTAVWMDLFRSESVPCSPINTIEQIAEDPVVAYRKMLATVEQPGVGKMRIAGSPFHMSATPGEVRTPAPLLGEHSVEVLRDLLEYSVESIQDLRDRKAVYAHEDLK